MLAGVDYKAVAEVSSAPGGWWCAGCGASGRCAVGRGTIAIEGISSVVPLDGVRCLAYGFKEGVGSRVLPVLGTRRM